MVTSIYSKYGRNFLGNLSGSKKEVHQLSNENTNCQIDEILKAGHAVGFNPDTLEEAHENGYDNCYYCIGGSKR